MYIYLRYSFIFLLSILSLSNRGSSHLLLDDVAAVQLWGNHAEVRVQEGRGRIDIESTLGLSFLFVSPSGTCFSFCLGPCDIDLYVPPSRRVSLWFDQASISAASISHLKAQLNYGSVYIRDVDYGDVSLFRGEIDALVAPKGKFYLRGEELNGQIFSNGEGWKHRVHHKGVLFEEYEHGVAESLISVQFYRGKLELLRDTFVMHF